MAGEAVLRVVVEDGGEVTAPVPVPPGQPGVGAGSVASTAPGLAGPGTTGMSGAGVGGSQTSSPHGQIPATVPAGSIVNISPPPKARQQRGGQQRVTRQQRPKRRSQGVLSSLSGPLNRGANVASSLLGGGGIAATIGGTAMALGGVGVAAGIVIATFAGLTSKAKELADGLTKYSGALSATKAQQQVANILNDIRLAGKYGNNFADFANTQSGIDRSIKNITASFQNLFISYFGPTFRFVESSLQRMEKYLEKMDELSDWLQHGIWINMAAAAVEEKMGKDAADLFRGMAEAVIEAQKKQNRPDVTMERLFRQINMPQFQPGPHLPIPPVNPLGGP